MRHQWPPAPSREVWFHRGWAVEERWTLRHINKTHDTIRLCKEIWEPCSCATLVLAWAQGHLLWGVLWREVWVGTSRHRIGALLTPIKHFIIPKASDFVLKGSQEDGFWPNAEVWTFERPWKRSLKLSEYMFSARDLPMQIRRVGERRCLPDPEAKLNWGWLNWNFCFLFFFLVLGIEFTTSHLAGRCLHRWAIPPVQPLCF